MQASPATPKQKVHRSTLPRATQYRPTALRSMYGSAESRLDANAAGVIGFLGRGMFNMINGRSVIIIPNCHACGQKGCYGECQRIQAPRLVSSDRLGRNLKLSERR